MGRKKHYVVQEALWSARSIMGCKKHYGGQEALWVAVLKYLVIMMTLFNKIVENIIMSIYALILKFSTCYLIKWYIS